MTMIEQFDMRATTPSEGSLIHGTHRAQDLIPALLDAVKLYNKPGYHGLMAAAFGPVPAFVFDEGEDSDWWNTDQAQCLLQELIDLLEDVAPDGTYFGTHPGDGSDWGWWQEVEIG